MVTLTVSSVGWRPIESDKDYVHTSDLGVFSIVALKRLSEDEKLTAISASLTIEDPDVLNQLTSYQDLNQELEWRFEFEDPVAPLEVKLYLEQIDEESGGIDLIYERVPRDLIEEIGIG